MQQMPPRDLFFRALLCVFACTAHSSAGSGALENGLLWAVSQHVFNAYGLSKQVGERRRGGGRGIQRRSFLVEAGARARARANKNDEALSAAGQSAPPSVARS